MTRANWRHPDATVALPANADRADWLLERRNGIGGTDAAAIMGVNLYATTADVYAEKTSTEPPVELHKPILQFGHVLEDHLVALVAERHDVTTRKVGLLRHKDDPWRYANPDGFTSDGGIIECKTTGRRTRTAAEWAEGRIPGHAYTQGQHYLAVTGRTHLYYAVAIRNDYAAWEQIPRKWWGTEWFRDVAVVDAFVTHRIDRDEAYIENLIAAEREVWAAIEARTPPPGVIPSTGAGVEYTRALDGTSTEAAIPELARDTSQRLAEVKAAQKALGDERSALERALKAEFGDAEYLTAGGVPIARWFNVETNRLDSKALQQDHPDLAAQYTRTRTSRRFDLIEGATA